MKKITILALVIIFCLPFRSLAQWQWLTGSRMPSSEKHGILYAPVACSDNNGGMYIAAITQKVDTCYFGSHSLYLDTSLYQTVISKIDSSGNYSWAKKITAGYFAYSCGIKADTSGEVYVLGYFLGDFCAFDNDTLLNPYGFSWSGFLAKFDSAGHLMWKQALLSAPGADLEGGVGIDPSGNVIVCGAFYGSGNIGSIPFSVVGGTDIFLAKFTPAGTPVWAESFGGTSLDYADHLTITPGGSIYVLGRFFSPSISFGPTTLFNSTDTNFNVGSYLLKSDNDGNVTWAVKCAGKGYDSSFSYTLGFGGLACDQWGSVYISGSFTDTAFLFGGHLLVNNGTKNAILAKYDSSGYCPWALSYGGTGSIEGFGLSVDGCGFVWVEGVVNDTSGMINFNGQTVPCPTYTHTNSPVYVAEFDQSGDYISSFFFESGGNGSGGMSTDSSGHFYFGSYYTTPSITAGPFTITQQDSVSNEFGAKYHYVNPGDTAHAHSDSIVCFSRSVVLNGPDGYTSYWWNDGRAGKRDTISVAGTYVVTATIICNGSVTITDTFHVTFNLPTDTVTADTSLCVRDSFIRAPGGYNHYVWNDGSVGAVHSISASGTVWVRCSDSCSSRTALTDTFHVTYKPSSDTLYHTIDTFLCGGPVTLSAPPGYTFYQWSTLSTTASITVNTAGSYWVYCDHACPDTTMADSFKVLNVPADLVFSLGNDTDICSPATLHVPPNGALYTWQDGSVADSFSVNRPGMYFATAVRRGCSFADSVTITYSDLTQHLRDTTVCDGAVIALTATVNLLPGATALWSTGSSSADIQISLPGSYSVVITKGQCSYNDTITVKTEECPKVVVHDVITPNGDGLNDTWVIEHITDHPGSRVMVFDKWGDKLFESNNYANDWAGNDLPDGTYFYVVKLNLTHTNRSGDVIKGALLIKR
jgi:gliding motility-associated-like protein